VNPASAERTLRADQPSPWRRASLAFGLAYPALLTLVYFVGLADATRPVQQGAYVIGKAVQFGLPLAWYLRRAGRPWRPVRPSGHGVLLGGAVGLMVLAAALALYHGLLVPHRVLAGAPAAAIRAKVVGFGVVRPWSFAVLAAFYAVVHSAAEELYWRGFVFGELRRSTPVGWAILSSGAGFAAHHVILLAVFLGWASPWTWALSLAVACGGAFWAWLYQRSGSLLGPWLGHALVDAAIFAVAWDLVR
jgi:uncharacterized protein